jgi:hypothetical protein
MLEDAVNVDALGPGRHLDGFLHVATAGSLDELLPCVSAWSFLVPHARRTVLARNAFGALLLREHDGHAYLLDPARVEHRYAGSGSELDAPGFLVDAGYGAWRASRAAPGVRDVLVPVGGELVATDIVAYYASTGATHERACLSSAAPFAGWPEFSDPQPLDDGRTWTARFDSWNERLDDIYYLATVDGTSFMVQLYISVDFRLPVFPELLRRGLGAQAATGSTNTEHHR